MIKNKSYKLSIVSLWLAGVLCGVSALYIGSSTLVWGILQASSLTFLVCWYVLSEDDRGVIKSLGIKYMLSMEPSDSMLAWKMTKLQEDQVRTILPYIEELRPKAYFTYLSLTEK